MSINNLQKENNKFLLFFLFKLSFMDIQKILSEFKKKIDLEIKDYLNKAVKEARKKDYLISEALRYVKKFVLSGGKRLRAARRKRKRKDTQNRGEH